MKFKYSVIGDNTQENREWLEKLGYKFRFGSTSTRNDYKFIKTKMLCTNIGKTYAIADLKHTVNDIEEEKTINCIGNHPLFKAVSAMREDSDYMQHFTNGRDWCKCYLPIFSHFAFHQQVEASIDLIANWHKATLTELQERFKEKEK